MDSISNSNNKANTIADEGRPFKKAKSCDETATSTIVTDRGDNSESDADENEVEDGDGTKLNSVEADEKKELYQSYFDDLIDIAKQDFGITDEVLDSNYGIRSLDKIAATARDDCDDDDKENEDPVDDSADGDSKLPSSSSSLLLIEAESSDENTCAVCMESASEERQILAKHNCPQCAPDAWKICDICDNHMISKICPVCRSDYAPRILYKVQGHPLCAVMPADKSQRLVDAELKRAVAKATFLKKILGLFDVALLCPVESVLLFIYPNQKSDEPTAEIAVGGKEQGASATICVAEIPMSADKLILKDDKFELNNKVWDDLEKQIEAGGDCHILAPGAAFKRLFDATRRVGSVLLTPLSPPDFDEAIADMITI